MIQIKIKSLSEPKTMVYRVNSKAIPQTSEDCLSRLGHLIKLHEKQINKVETLKQQLAHLLKEPNHNKKQVEGLKDKIEQAKEKAADIRCEARDVHNDHLIFQDFETKGLLGTSLLGQVITGVFQAAILPSTYLINHLATARYAKGLGIAVILSQLGGAATQPALVLQQLRANATKIPPRQKHEASPTQASAENTKPNIINPKVDTVETLNLTCAQNPTPECAEFLVNSWCNAAGNLTQQEPIEVAIMGNATALSAKANQLSNSTGCYNISATIDNVVHSRNPNNIYEAISTPIDGDICDGSYSAEQMVEYSLLAEHVYRRNETHLPKGWRLNSAIAKHLANSTGFTLYENINLVLSPNGLVVHPFEKVNNSTGAQEICLVFGGTTSGRFSGGLLARISDTGSFLGQLFAIIQNFLGYHSNFYQDAKNIAQELVKKYSGNNTTISIVGHSLGASAGAFAAGIAGSVEKPISLYGFETSQLSCRSKKEIAQRVNNTHQARQLISRFKQVVVQGDMIPTLRNEIEDTSILGTRYLIEPSKAQKKNGPTWLHSKFTWVIANHAQRMAENNTTDNAVSNATCVNPSPPDDIHLGAPAAASLVVTSLAAIGGVAACCYCSNRKKINFQPLELDEQPALSEDLPEDETMEAIPLQASSANIEF